MSDKVILVPIAMRKPSEDFIQAPSVLWPEIEMSEAEFNDQVADTAKASLVSLEPDGISNPQKIIAYTVPIEVSSGSKGWIGRFIKK